ncbi:response regulator transcription factor [Citricoccus muralis]|uniref:Response regulator transcription factor n=1 Tax=Citricoccus muralis TaxID=169134 RepID=A0ABY8H4J2_9MICC|nr:response regulator transcription factor [Citricoccus muralis]WFP15764.1 response regulator transcription factor [Citricoccus muralis]
MTPAPTSEPTSERPSELIRLLLADDQHLVRAGLAALLNLEDDLDVIHQQSSGAGLVAAVQEHRIDVAVLDIEMPGMDGITATETLTATLEQPPAVLILTTFGRTGYLQRAMAAGARGFMVKDAPAEQLAAAIRTVHAGGRAVDPGLAAEALSIPASPLTEREADVLRAALTGASVKAIAAQLFLSPGTVRNHLSAAIGKTGTTNRAEAARQAQSHGWL